MSKGFPENFFEKNSKWVLTNPTYFAIINKSPREKRRRNAEVSELADEQD